jgi:hypothetical protein
MSWAKPTPDVESRSWRVNSYPETLSEAEVPDFRSSGRAKDREIFEHEDQRLLIGYSGLGSFSLFKLLSGVEVLG